MMPFDQEPKIYRNYTPPGWFSPFHKEDPGVLVEGRKHGPRNQQPQRVVMQPTPKSLPEPVDCPYLGERRHDSTGTPLEIKCGCSANLMFPVFECLHPENRRTNRHGEKVARGALPTIGYRPKQSHVPKDFYTPCMFCTLNHEKETSA